MKSRWRPGRQRWRRAIPQSSTREARFTGMKKRHVSESLCLKKTNVTKRSRGRHAAKMLLGRKHANFWRTSDCAVVAVEKNMTWQRLNTLWFRLFRTSRVCCVLRCGFCSHLYLQPFSVAKLNVSLFFLFQSSTCLLAGVAPGNTTVLKLERFHQRNASPTHIYTFFLFQFALCLPAGVSPGIAVASDDQLFWQEM